ncbi:hypothetical protein DOM21_14785 [Bacteriovorax stolpii]|uniref:GIY-YIG nuclease family protein n=1 Tax=Bacteriovorax stolpii TaxID=960 RepID=UPI00115731C5|nr:GIY-YIG nuclease family protein [Bacteriovorax stolpii]QDK42692.1 hypothetical protein DOM21_14785 [Bacteriovorax stolpii]
MKKTRGKVLKIFIIGNDSRSLKSVELVNWTGLAYIGKRSQLKQLEELKLFETGVYFLLSETSNDSAITEIYIGESDSFLDRLKKHAYEKDWWTHFVVFVSKDQSLTKAHIKYLEKELYALAARAIGTLKLVNPNEPGGAKLSDPEIATMEEFLENIIFVLETMGLGYFPRSESSFEAVTRKCDVIKSNLEQNIFSITQPKDVSEGGVENFLSYLSIKDDVYVLKAGAYIRKEPKPSFKDHNYFPLWQQIVSSEIVKNSANINFLVTTQDVEFSSASAAAAVVRGGATNGRTEWKRKTDQMPLYQWEVIPNESK